MKLWGVGAGIRNFLKPIFKKSQKKALLNIEISDCNLHCLMCPRNPIHSLGPKKTGMMSLSLFEAIVRTLLKEKIYFTNLAFGNWGEPLRNPYLPQMIEYARRKLSTTKIYVFTNLTVLPMPEAIMFGGVTAILISVSGMRQEVYSMNHRGGNIRTVLNHINTLVTLANTMEKPPRLILRFHDYVYNHQDRCIAEEFCRMNRIEFELLRCYPPGVEASINYEKNKQVWEAFYSRFIDMEREKKLRHTLKNHKDCCHLKDSMVINYDAQLYRCCGVYEDRYLLGSFFDLNLREIDKLKTGICDICADTPMSWR